MEKALFPLKYMKQIQSDSYAINYGNNGIKENVYAPFTGIIKKIYSHRANEVWLESVDKVLWANGKIDYMTILTAHDDDVSHLNVGDIIKQGQVYYHQGTKGKIDSPQVHIEIGKGKFYDSGWYQNAKGNWIINDAVHPADALFLIEDVIIANDGGYNWQKLLGKPVSRDFSKNQIEVISNKLECYKNPNSELLGYVNEGIYNILDSQYKGDYNWYQIELDKWISYHQEWVTIYLKEENVDALILKLTERINELENLNQQLLSEIEQMKQDNRKLNSQIKFTYNCLKDGKYVIKLYKGEVLQIK